MKVSEAVEASPHSLYAKLSDEVKAQHPKEAGELMRIEFEIADMALRHAMRDAPIAGRIFSAVLTGMTTGNAEMMEAASEEIKKVSSAKGGADEAAPAMERALRLMPTLGFSNEDTRQALVNFYSAMKSQFIKSPEKFEFSGVAHQM